MKKGEVIHQNEKRIFFISQKGDKLAFIISLCLTLLKISQKVFITQKWFSYHLKADIKMFPTSGITLLYDNHLALSDRKCILVSFYHKVKQSSF